VKRLNLAFPSILAAWMLLGAANVALPLFTILFDFLIALFTGLLWYTSKQQWKVTRAALHINRPFLIVAMPEMKVADEVIEGAFRHVPKCVHISVENFGTGPADIIDVSVEVIAFDPPMPEPKVIYRPENRHQSNVPILGAAKSAEIFRRDIDLGRPSDVLAILEETRWLGVYGEIRYRGGPPDEVYLTHFFWWYFPRTPKEQNFSRALTPELNSRT